MDNIKTVRFKKVANKFDILQQFATFEGRETLFWKDVNEGEYSCGQITYTEKTSWSTSSSARLPLSRQISKCVCVCVCVSVSVN